MVDEAAFKRVANTAYPLPCPFGQALLAGCCACSRVTRHQIAEREALVCTLATAHQACTELHGLLRQNSQFAIRDIRDAAPITHAQHLKIQCGGLQGVQLEVDGSPLVADVYALVEAARQKFGTADQFPYEHIVRAVAAYRARKRNHEST